MSPALALLGPSQDQSWRRRRTAHLEFSPFRLSVPARNERAEVAAEVAEAVTAVALVLGARSAKAKNGQAYGKKKPKRGLALLRGRRRPRSKDLLPRSKDLLPRRKEGLLVLLDGCPAWTKAEAFCFSTYSQCKSSLRLLTNWPPQSFLAQAVKQASSVRLSRFFGRAWA